MGFGKFLAGAAGVVGAVVLAPVALPAAAAAGASVLATGAAAAGAVGSAVATGAAAVASTAVGSAAVAGMGAIGTGVASAAGAVGLTSVATVAGTTTGAAALGTIATGTVLGAGNALSGAGKIVAAGEVKDQADDKLKRFNTMLAKTEKSMNNSLEELGEVKKSVWCELDSFIKVSSKIKNIPKHGELAEDGYIVFDKMDIDNMKNISKLLNDTIAGGLVSLTGGSLIGFATASGLTSIATASTGTAIAGLNGAAATNASLAALGGGSIATGGLGMAGGAIVMNALAFAPAVAIGGVMIGRKGSKKLESAKDYADEVDRYAEEVKSVTATMKRLQQLSQKMKSTLKDMEMIFHRYYICVIETTERTTDFKCFTRQEQQSFFIAVKLGRILSELTCTELINAETGIVKSEEVEDAIKNYETVVDDYR